MPLPILPDNASAIELRDALTEVGAETRALINKRSAGEDFSDTDKSDLERNLRYIKDLDPVLSATMSIESVREPVKAPTAALDTTRQYRTAGQLATEHEAYSRIVRDGGLTTNSYEYEIKDAQLRTTITSSTSDTSAGGVFLTPASPLMPIPRQQRLFVEQLLGSANTNSPAVPYILEKNPATNETGASATAEAAAYSEATLEYASQTAKIVKITAWVPATEEIIADAPVFQSYIDNRLAYMVSLRKEQQILKGADTGAQMKGILTWSVAPFQNQTQAAVAGDVPATLAQAIGKVENVDLPADGVVMNPLDFWTAVGTRHSNALDNGYGGEAPNILGGISFGFPMVRSRSMATGAAAVGSFALGATVLNRTGLAIRIGEQHSDYFIKGMVAIAASVRAGVATHRPDAFVNVTIA